MGEAWNSGCLRFPEGLVLRPPKQDAREANCSRERCPRVVRANLEDEAESAEGRREGAAAPLAFRTWVSVLHFP